MNDEYVYGIVITSMFKKDLKTAKKRGYDLSLLDDVVDTLAKGLPLDQKYKDHNLIGNYKGCRECHITPDWLLIYEIDNNELILYLTRTGTHSVSLMKWQKMLREISLLLNSMLPTRKSMDKRLCLP